MYLILKSMVWKSHMLNLFYFVYTKWYVLKINYADLLEYLSCNFCAAASMILESLYFINTPDLNNLCLVVIFCSNFHPVRINPYLSEIKCRQLEMSVKLVVI